MNELAVIMRSLGMNPTKTELTNYMREKNGKLASIRDTTSTIMKFLTPHSISIETYIVGSSDLTGSHMDFNKVLT